MIDLLQYIVLIVIEKLYNFSSQASLNVFLITFRMCNIFCIY